MSAARSHGGRLCRPPATRDHGATSGFVSSSFRGGIDFVALHTQTNQLLAARGALESAILETDMRHAAARHS